MVLSDFRLKAQRYLTRTFNGKRMVSLRFARMSYIIGPDMRSSIVSDVLPKQIQLMVIFTNFT